MMRYPLNRLHEEVAFIAVNLGWGHDDILSLTHTERARWIAQINQINRQRRGNKGENEQP